MCGGRSEDKAERGSGTTLFKQNSYLNQEEFCQKENQLRCQKQALSNLDIEMIAYG